MSWCDPLGHRSVPFHAEDSSSVANTGETGFLFERIAPDDTHFIGWRCDLQALHDHTVSAAHGLDLPDGLDLIERLMDRTFGARALNIHRNAQRIRAISPGSRSINGRAAFPIDQMREMRFEWLMQVLEDERVRVCVLLGVPFEPGMLEYHHDTSYGSPDPRLTEQWKRKATSQEVALLKVKCGSLLAKRGEAVSVTPHHLGSRETHRRLRRRMSDRSIRTMK